jgi:hypothetical protein
VIRTKPTVEVIHFLIHCLFEVLDVQVSDVSFLGGCFSNPVEFALSSIWEAYPQGVKRPVWVGIDSCEPWFAKDQVVATQGGEGGVDGVFKSKLPSSSLVVMTMVAFVRVGKGSCLAPLARLT